jgi:hypothetical protein
VVQVVVPSDHPSVPVSTVRAGDTWSFSASGQWTNGFIRCGPGGYRNFLADALQIEPRAGGRWFELIGKIEGVPDSAFPIGCGCTKTFGAGGELIVFANDTANGYGNNKGSVRLTALPGGVAPASSADGGFIGAWHRFRDVYGRIQGIPVIAALVLGVSWILVFMRQGQDLVRGIGEDNFWQYPSGLLQIAFGLGLLFLALQAWSWSRLVITSNYGTDRDLWRPQWLLVWAPRVLGALPFAAAAAALWMNSATNTWFALALIALGVIFFVFVVWRQDIQRRLNRGGATGAFRLFQRYWVIFSLIAAAAAMVAATLWPVGFGVLLGAPGVVFFGLGFIIPVIVLAIQIGASLRIPVVGALLAAAVIFGLWVDNHAVGRRAFGVATTGPTERPTLAQAYELWRSAQPGGADAKKTMLLVAVQGGASRAGYWTAVALSSLRETAKAKGVDLDSHLFAISSVSGGSVGSVGYAAMLKSAPDPADFNLRLLRFTGQNALGPTMTGMLFPDLLQRFLPVAFLPDRAEALERSWESAWGDSWPPTESASVASLMREPFLNLAPKAGEPWRPLLIVQGASENSGRRVLTSAVRFDCDEVDADDFLDGEDHDVAASTAILNGARFPWVSPGGTFPSYRDPADRCAAAEKVKDHILDGGYFDNAGAETLRELERALHAIRAKAGEKDPLDIIFVLIGYRDPNASKPTPALAINDVFAPLFGVFASMSAHEGHLAREMKLVGQSKVEEADPYVSRMNGGDVVYGAIVLCAGQIETGGRLKDYEPPMDWTLSGEAKRYIENSVIATTPACNAKANVETIGEIVGKLGR